MPVLLALLMLALLLDAPGAMAAASDACRLFAASVLPGLYPYMVLSLMAVSRVKRMSPGLLMLLGWGGGSPTGARLLPLCSGLPRREQVRLAVSCGTMSPMFLLGTAGAWLGSGSAGRAVLASVLLGGWLAGQAAALCTRDAAGPSPDGSASPAAPLSLGAAVEQSARTMLLVCGTMVMLRVLAELLCRVLPEAAALPATTLLEVTTGAVQLAALPLPLAWRTALVAGAAGFGGMAVILQNRAVLPGGLLSLPRQILFQAVHGAASFLIALGWMTALG